MSTGFLKLIIVAQIVALVVIYALCAAIAVYGLYGPAIAWIICGTMLVEPWKLRWPKDEEN